MTSPAAKKRQGLLIATNRWGRAGAEKFRNSVEQKRQIKSSSRAARWGRAAAEKFRNSVEKKKRQIKSSSRAARAASAEKFRKSV